MNLTPRLHQCTPELFWAEDPISLRSWGKKGGCEREGGNINPKGNEINTTRPERENFAPLSCALKTKTKPIAIKFIPKRFQTNLSQTFRALSLKSLQTTSNASTHTLFLSLGLEPTSIVGHSVQILFKGHKNQGVQTANWIPVLTKFLKAIH